MSLEQTGIESCAELETIEDEHDASIDCSVGMSRKKCKEAKEKESCAASPPDDCERSQLSWSPCVLLL
eukprot:15336232-Ditylum_brightwellii.AAC.2